MAIEQTSNIFIVPVSLFAYAITVLSSTTFNGLLEKIRTEFSR
jgi:hypothetical protein